MRRLCNSRPGWCSGALRASLDTVVLKVDEPEGVGEGEGEMLASLVHVSHLGTAVGVQPCFCRDVECTSKGGTSRMASFSGLTNAAKCIPLASSFGDSAAAQMDALLQSTFDTSSVTSGGRNAVVCRGRGLGFMVHKARGGVRACLGKMEQDSVNFGLVVPAQEEIYGEAVRALGNGQVVAVPTDTLYGLACDASSAAAIQRVYEIKERKLSSSLAVCVADVDLVGDYANTIHLPPRLLASLLPGAVTLLLPRRDSGRLSLSLNPGVMSIGIRIPESDFIRGLSRAFGGALALTSANTSSHASTVQIEEFKHLWPHCAFVFDAGKLPGGRAGSTIVDLSQEGVFKVVRPGSVLQKTRETLLAFGLQESLLS